MLWSHFSVLNNQLTWCQIINYLFFYPGTFFSSSANQMNKKKWNHDCNGCNSHWNYQNILTPSSALSVSLSLSDEELKTLFHSPLLKSNQYCFFAVINFPHLQPSNPLKVESLLAVSHKRSPQSCVTVSSILLIVQLQKFAVKIWNENRHSRHLELKVYQIMTTRNIHYDRKHGKVL